MIIKIDKLKKPNKYGWVWVKGISTPQGMPQIGQISQQRVPNGAFGNGTGKGSR